MSRLSYQKVFQDSRKLSQMLELRRQGWDVISLGILYNVHPDSIDYQCLKHGVHRGDSRLKLSISNILLVVKIPIYKVRNYKDYLKESSYADYLKRHSNVE